MNLSEMPTFQRDQARRRHMIEAADKLRSYTHGLSRTKLADPILDAILRRLGVFGEAAAEFSLTARHQYPAIPWGTVVGMRQYVIHQYFNIDLDEVWDNATRTVPAYAKVLRAKELKKPSAQLEAELVLALKYKKKRRKTRG